jgi:hypothetical protein
MLLVPDFIPLNELIESLPAETRSRWERLWMLPDRRDKVVHPLIYPHPVTKLPVRITSLLFVKPNSKFCGINSSFSLWLNTFKLAQMIRHDV